MLVFHAFNALSTTILASLIRPTRLPISKSSSSTRNDGYLHRSHNFDYLKLNRALPSRNMDDTRISRMNETSTILQYTWITYEWNRASVFVNYEDFFEWKGTFQRGVSTIFPLEKEKFARRNERNNIGQIIIEILKTFKSSIPTRKIN